jgi:formylglycine-generating enzyme required for sulfatase activity
MGSPNTEYHRSSNENQHNVTLYAFMMSKYEVTFEQYDVFCEAIGKNKPDGPFGRGKQPVVNVSWFDATAFAEWMGCRLPTEAEWEYACRAGTKTQFYTGGTLSNSKANYSKLNPNLSYEETLNIIKNKTMMPMPVGSFAPNPWGLFDMHGNVKEWCSDWLGDYPTTKQVDPKGQCHLVKRHIALL